MAKKVLVTGAGGFIGGFIVEEALKRGYETWAAVRATTSRKYLTDPRIKFIELDFSNEDNLRMQLGNAVNENGKWDFIVHNLGATKCTNFNDFNTVNYIYMKSFVDILQDMKIVPEKFLMMSSLGAVGLGDEVNYTPFHPDMIPNPNTRYGVSKLKAETYLQMQPDFPFVIFRCTGVYGPREKDYFMMIKTISRGGDFGVGYKKQLITFLYVKDLAAAVFDAFENGAQRKAYFLCEETPYTSTDFRKIVAEELGVKHVISIKAPIWLTKIVCSVAEFWGKMILKPSTLNSDKFKILKQRNWLCDTSEARNDFGFKINYTLKDGLKESIKWYKENGWLK